MFTLTVNGPGGPSTASVTVAVSAAIAPTANAGPDQTAVQRGTVVTLDGSTSTGASSYVWTQVVGAGDPTAILTGATTAKPTFTFPKYKSPAANGPLMFKLEVRNPNPLEAPSTDTVTITPTSDVVTIAQAEYQRTRLLWKINGTSSIPVGQDVVVHLGGLNGPVIGTAVVHAPNGIWSVKWSVAGQRRASPVSKSASSRRWAVFAPAPDHRALALTPV